MTTATPLTTGSTALTRRALALVTVLGPLALVFCQLTTPYNVNDDASEMARSVADHSGMVHASQAFLFVSSLFLIPGAIIVGLAAVRSSRRLGIAATILMAAAFAAISFVGNPDSISLAWDSAGLDPAQLDKVSDELGKQPAVLVAFLTFLIGHLAGLLLAGIAFLRGGLLPKWAGWLFVAAPVALFVTFGTGVAALTAVALAIVTAAWGAVALYVLREGVPT